MKIEAFFRGIKNANEVVSKLNNEGIEAYTDINDHFQLDKNTKNSEGRLLVNPLNSDLVLNSGVPGGDRDKSPMLAASPMVSGMGGFEEIADVNYKVVVNADTSNENKAKEIIKSLGGSVKNPNLEIEKHVKGIDFSKADPKFMKNLNQ